MAIPHILDSIKTNKKNHLVDFNLKTRSEQFADHLFHILFDANKPVKEHMDQVAVSFRDICLLLPEQEATDYDTLWKKFLLSLPDILEQLNQDANCIYQHDPAANSVEEVILAYPGFFAIALYRISHEFNRLGFPIVPRIMSEYAHRLTGIDIHPGAIIGCPFFIDHGTGIVIGESTVIKNHVKIYQGVTLGALQVSKSMRDQKRHPTVEDHVCIYAGATILGGDTVIGHNSTIGGNVWLTESVPPNTLVYQQPDTQMKIKSAHED